MKVILLYLSLLLSIICMAQPAGKEELLSFIRQNGYVVDQCSSNCDCLKVPDIVFLKQDTLFRNSSFNEWIDYFHDSSYIVKCYAFNEILFQNDSLALELLKKNVHDTSTVLFAYHHGLMQFNQFMVNEYLKFIKMKYLSIGFNYWSATKRINYYTGKIEKKLFKKKYKYLREFVEKMGYKVRHDGKYYYYPGFYHLAPTFARL